MLLYTIRGEFFIASQRLSAKIFIEFDFGVIYSSRNRLGIIHRSLLELYSYSFLF